MGHTSKGAFAFLGMHTRHGTRLGLDGQGAIQGHRVLVAIQEGPRPHELNAIACQPLEEQPNLSIVQIIPAQGSPVMPAADGTASFAHPSMQDAWQAPAAARLG